MARRFRAYGYNNSEYNWNDKKEDYEWVLGDKSMIYNISIVNGLDEIHNNIESLLFDQYTGLIDINGKEICENDIVKWGKGLESNERIAVVEIGKCGISFNSLQNGRFMYYNFIYTDTEKYLEVVGNTHEDDIQEIYNKKDTNE